MANSAFRLSRVLRLRVGTRDLRRHELAEALLAEEILGDRRRDLDRRRAELSDATRAAAGPGAVNLERIMQAQRYEAVLMSESALLAKQEALLTEEISRRRQAVVDADRDVRALEILEQRHHAKQRQAAEKADTRQLDEYATWVTAAQRVGTGLSHSPSQSEG
jgi:flagellar export protein FliJ